MAAPYSPLVIANEFIDRSLSKKSPITQMQLQKLCYFAHGWHLALYGQPLLEDNFQAWDFGPVCPTLYSALKKYGKSPIKRNINWGDDTPFSFDDDGPARDCLTDNEKEVVEEVWNAYGEFPAFKLSALTHVEGTPWSQIFDHGRNKVIPNELISGYFESLLKAE